MAITDPTTTGQFAGFLRPDQAAPFFTEARRVSVAQQLIRQVPVGINGVETPVNMGKLTAAWVAEAGQKPASKGALGLTTIRAYKIAAIAVVSAEMVRANPGGYMDTIRPDIGEAFGLAFDAAVFAGTNSPFGTDQNLAAATQTVELGTTTPANGGIYGDFNAAISLLVNNVDQGRGKKLTGWALDDRLEPMLNGAVDLNGRPLFIESPYEDSNPAVRNGRLIGRPTRMSDGIANGTTLGYGADWSQMVWGQVGGISYDVSTQATVTIDGALVSLWENNLIAIRAEAEYAFKIKPGVTNYGADNAAVGAPTDPGGGLESVVKLLNATP